MSLLFSSNINIIFLLDREVLGSLGHLRIDESRIKPIESKPKSGTSGRERTEVAILVSTQSSNSSKRDDIEFIAVKKQPFDPKNDDRALAVCLHGARWTAMGNLTSL